MKQRLRIRPLPLLGAVIILIATATPALAQRGDRGDRYERAGDRVRTRIDGNRYPERSARPSARATVRSTARDNRYNHYRRQVYDRHRGYERDGNRFRFIRNRYEPRSYRRSSANVSIHLGNYNYYRPSYRYTSPRHEYRSHYRPSYRSNHWVTYSSFYRPIRTYHSITNYYYPTYNTHYGYYHDYRRSYYRSSYHRPRYYRPSYYRPSSGISLRISTYDRPYRYRPGVGVSFRYNFGL